MRTTMRKAVNPETGQEYKIEMPAPEEVREAILGLDYPSDGIRLQDAIQPLSEKLELSPEQKTAVKKDGERYLPLFYHGVVYPQFRHLLEVGKLEQPGESRTPYFLADDGQEKLFPSAEETIAEKHTEIQNALAGELLQKIKGNSAEFFEELVIDLLVAMGYGGAREDAGRPVGRSGDGGIDGIIKADPLGLNVVYIQAKRWEGNVGAPPLRDFVGALDGEGVQDGIFITTSDFNPAAEQFAEKSSKRVILINGSQLARYMIDHNVGVSVTKTYEIKRVDSDYFAENTENS